MQIRFYSNKESIIELFNWIKNKYPDLDFYSEKDNARFKEDDLYTNSVGYHNVLWMTLKDSVLSNKMVGFEKCEHIHCKVLFQNSIEFTFGYFDELIYNYDLINYNPYKKELNTEPFYYCRIWLDSYYLGDNEIYTKMYKSIFSKIRRNSVRVCGNHIEAYLLKIK